MEHARLWILLAALLGGSGVAIGAFGAHWLPGHLTARGISGEELTKRAANWETASRYQMYHALALFAVAWLATTPARGTVSIAGWLFVIGVVIFSGCLYINVLSGLRIFGVFVMFGGFAFIAGWITLLIGGLQTKH